MSAALLVGIDVGTASSKGVLTDLRGQVLHQVQIEHAVSWPAPGHAEQDADHVWWHDVCAIARQLAERARATAGGHIAGVAVSAIGPCLLPLDDQYRPLRPGILYGVDTRATRQIAALEEEIGADEIFRFSQLALSSQAVGPKIRWLRECEPDIWERTAWLTSATSYLTFRLTGRLCLDHHSASHFAPLYDPVLQRWDARHATRITSIERLPELAWAQDCAGTVSAEAAEATGLPWGTPVAVGTIDALSEALSVGAVAPGDLMVMHGSTTFFILAQAQSTPDRRMWTVKGIGPGALALAAGMGTTGSLTRWFREELARDLQGLPSSQAWAKLFDEARTVPPGAGGLLVLPYFSGERTPILDPDAAGVILGLNLHHERRHLFRAVLEGIGFGIRHNLETFESIGAPVHRLVAVGGGAQSDIGLQIFSDICGRPQQVPQVTVGASYGDAFLAGWAAGLLRPEHRSDWVRPGRIVEPRPQATAVYDRLYPHYLAAYRGTRDTVHALRAFARGTTTLEASSPVASHQNR